MKLGAVAGMRDDPESFARHAKRLEQAGVSYLWSGEAHSGDKNAAAAMVPAALVEAISLVGDEGFARPRGRLRRVRRHHS